MNRTERLALFASLAATEDQLVKLKNEIDQDIISSEELASFNEVWEAHSTLNELAHAINRSVRRQAVVVCAGCNKSYCECGRRSR